MSQPPYARQFSLAIYQYLASSQLLAGELPEAASWNRSQLAAVSLASLPELNFQQKLGHLYEDALYHLMQAADVQVVARNLQIQSDRHHTIGELDFLIADGEQMVHLELACKFYLAVVDPAGNTTFPGPNARDNLQIKLTRMREHQLVLSKNPATLKTLQARWPDASLTTRQLIYGYLFDHIHSSQLAGADFIHDSCPRGKWLYQDEFLQLENADQQMYQLPKPLWPVDVTAELLELLEPIQPAAITSLDRACMIYNPLENQRYFVMPNSWPAELDHQPDS